MSARQNIVTAVMTALAGIKTANGYHSNAGNNCKELSDVPVTAFPAIRVNDAQSEVVTEEIPFGFHEHRLTVIVAGYANTMQAARELAEDITAVMWEGRRWGGSARWTALNRHDITQVHAEKKYCSCELEFTITYRTALGAI